MKTFDEYESNRVSSLILGIGTALACIHYAFFPEHGGSEVGAVITGGASAFFWVRFFMNEVEGYSDE